MLGNLTVLHAEKVVESHVAVAELAFAHREDEVALAKDFVVLIVDHLKASCGHIGKCLSESVQTIGNAGVVLNIVVAVVIGREGVHILAHQDIVHKAFN